MSTNWLSRILLAYHQSNTAFDRVMSKNSPVARFSAVVVVIGGYFLLTIAAAAKDREAQKAAEKSAKTSKTSGEEISLFDGKTLKGWKHADFVGQGQVKVQNGELVLGKGDDMTGVVCTETIPKLDYEVTLEAKRVEGRDFFCGLTFPVGESPCSLIVGGWGGTVVGLSSLNGQDASENDTTSYHTFELGKWYKIRLKVTKEKIEAWIDAEKVVDVETKDREISIRIEVEPCRPFGLATWRTTGAIRNIKLRRV